MIKIVFFSTPKIGLKSLEYLAKSKDIEVLAVVTQEDKPAGRGHKLSAPPIKILAQELGIKVFQPKSIRKDLALQDELKKLKPDFFVTFAFGQILSQEVLDIPQIATINLHASLLPKYRGANPIQRAIAAGEKITGITTMITELTLDTGDICLIDKIEITAEMTDVQLAAEIAEKSPKLIEETLIGLRNKTIIPIKQNDNEATYADKFKKEDAKIDFSKPARDVSNLVRALYSAPTTYTYFKGKILKIIKAEMIEETTYIENSVLIKKDSKGLYISCGGHVLLISKIKPEGKGEMDAFAWANGAGIKIGDKFGE